MLSTIVLTCQVNPSDQYHVMGILTQKPFSYVKKPLGPPPPSYTCFRWGKPGHYIKNCPTNGVRLWGASGVTWFLIALPWQLHSNYINTPIRNCVSWAEIQRFYGSGAKPFKIPGKAGIFNGKFSFFKVIVIIYVHRSFSMNFNVYFYIFQCYCKFFSS